MKKDWDALEALRHSRHDWLNKLQLIKGNIALNHIDRVKLIIDEIVMDANHESNLSNLKANQFASLLITCNWENYHFKIEYEVLGHVKDLSKYDDHLTSWYQNFFQVVNQSVNYIDENHLCISIDLTYDHPRFFLDFSGTIDNIPQLNNWIESQYLDPTIKILENEVHNHEMTIVLKLT